MLFGPWARQALRAHLAGKAGHVRAQDRANQAAGGQRPVAYPLAEGCVVRRLAGSPVVVKASSDGGAVEHESGCLLRREDIGRLSARQESRIRSIMPVQVTVVAERPTCNSHCAPNRAARTSSLLDGGAVHRSRSSLSFFNANARSFRVLRSAEGPTATRSVTLTDSVQSTWRYSPVSRTRVTGDGLCCLTDYHWKMKGAV
jgi:hypothetical protein